MSGFDFEALRDPLAPEPGARERSDVETRARRLRARNRRARIAVSATSIVAVAAIVLGVVALTRNPGPSVTVEGPSTTVPPTTTPTTAGPSVASRFIPPTSTQNGLVVLPVTLPDGETFTLRYPPAMKIAQLGFAGGIGVDYPVSTGAQQCCGSQVRITYTTIQHVYGDATPIKVYRGPNGEAVPYFHAGQSIAPPDSTKQDYLVFQFGPWLVQVSDTQQPDQYDLPMTDAQRATWARSLTGTVDAHGYLVLHAQAPLSVNDQFEGTFGAEPGNYIELASHLYCGRSNSDTTRRRSTNGDGSKFVSWCDGALHVVAGGSSTFIDLGATKLQVSALTAPAATPPTATTTTTPVAPTPVAVSASFVSPDHGWVLDQSGFVWETTDGGSTWKEISQVSVQADTGKRIRFADALHGFEFDAESNHSSSLLATDDGGLHWKDLAVPFSDIYDLAISRGVVYVVALQQDSPATFRIWSSPADNLAWTQDPFAVPVGAGPVPSAQLVFSGASGRLLVINRVVIGGARLGPNGRWTAWTPPCINAGGPAELAASTASDLVAMCDEGVWTGPKVTPAVYFSHDGGYLTFQRKVAPVNGAIASPDPHTAVILLGNTLRRTTDDGATWRIVYSIHDESGASPPDMGFTTPTQGFAIIQNGAMLMTYDAGASWKQVTLP